MLARLPPAPSFAARGHRPFPGPARSRGLASLWARLLGTSLPGRVFPGRRWPRSTGFGLLQPAGAARAQPGPAPAAAAAPSCFLRPGRPRQQCLGECGPPWAETASGASPGAGGARLRGAWRSGSLVLSRPAGRGDWWWAGLFGAPGSQLVHPQGLPRRHLGPAKGGSGKLRRNTPSSATNQSGGHPDSTVGQLLLSGPQPSFWRQTWVCTHYVTLDKSFHLPSLSCLIS